MVKTGTVAVIETNAGSAHDEQARYTSLRWRLLSGLSAITFVVAVTLPITTDSTNLLPSLASAMAADNGNGDGQGKGNGNGKGRGDEYGNGNGPGGGNGARDDDDDEDHDDDDAGDSDPGDDNANDNEHAGGSNDGIPGEFGEIEDSAFTDVAEDVPTLPDRAAPALPTIREVFALGDESVLNAEQELLAIQNGWNSRN